MVVQIKPGKRGNGKSFCCNLYRKRSTPVHSTRDCIPRTGESSLAISYVKDFTEDKSNVLCKRAMSSVKYFTEDKSNVLCKVVDGNMSNVNLGSCRVPALNVMLGGAQI